MASKKGARQEEPPPAAERDEKEPKEHGGAASLAFTRARWDLLRWADSGIDLSMRLFHVLIKVLGPCLIFLALSLVSYCTYTFFVHFLPATDDVMGLHSKVALSAVGLFLEFNALYNYAMSICMDPGVPPDYGTALREWQEQGEELAKPKPRQCKKCSRLKPPRCHHCSVCKKCILRMDHHCPWINNCVGYRNHRHFCLFMLFMALVSLFIVLCFFRHFRDMTFFARRRRSHQLLSREGRQCIMTCFMLCCSIVVALCMLGGFHVYLVATNQTTIEFQTNLVKRRAARKNGELYRNPYNLGRTRNFQQVFGPNEFCSFKWLLPWWLAKRPIGDGLSYPSMRISE